MLSVRGYSQKIDSIYFNLYTDSLKKGTYNYINVDGKSSDGKYLPLTSKELHFTASAGKFEGNSLYVDSTFNDDKITIRATLDKNPALWKEVVIYIKKNEAIEKLRSIDEIMNKGTGDSSSGRKKKKKS